MSDKRDLWPEVPEVDLGTIIRPREAHRCEDRWICRACAAEYCGSLSETSFAEHVAHAVPYLNVGKRVIYDRKDLDLWLSNRKTSPHQAPRTRSGRRASTDSTPFGSPSQAVNASSEERESEIRRELYGPPVKSTRRRSPSPNR